MLLSLVFYSGRAEAQTPAAPTIDSVTPADGSLIVAWTAPSGVTGITAYDLRYIRSDAADKADTNWTTRDDVWTTGSGDLTYTLEGLDNGVGYDVQMRTVTTTDGAWSAASTGTPQIPGPTITSVVAGAGALTAAWTAPTVATGTTISSYDARYIESAATDKSDGKWTVVTGVWTSGSLSYVLTGLRDSTGYDVQVRATTSSDAGLWSATSTGTTSDHGDSVADATTITIDAQVPGRIDADGDTDHFTFTLASATYVLLEAATEAGALTLTPTLYDSQGTEIDLYYLNEPGWSVIDDQGLSLYALGRLKAGTYTVRLAAAASETGSYLLEPQVATDMVVDEATCQGYSMAQSDPLYGCQWYLKNTNQYGAGGGFDINVEQAWQTTKGEGINVLVVDSGLDYLHSDLRGYEYDSDDPDDDTLGHHGGGAAVRIPLGQHGTAVTGIIAARDNDVGTRGVAPRATVYGYTVPLSILMVTELRAARPDAAAYKADTTAVSSNSWAVIVPGYHGPVDAEWLAAVEEGLTSGYGGKGVVYVWLAGNGHLPSTDTSGRKSSQANLEEMKTHYGVTVACGVNYNDVRSSFSELGANLWVCAPSNDGDMSLPGILSTDLHNRYVEFGGTSAATPIVSGVAALIRGANSTLTWRDVKLILAGSARKNDTSNTGWAQGALKYGSSTDQYSFNHEYGFGVVDAGAAVTLAGDWTNLPSFLNISASATAEMAIPDPPVGGTASAVSSSVTLGSSVEFVEYMAIELTFNHQDFCDLFVELVSPSGTTSTLLFPFTPGGCNPANDTWRLGSARHLGESAGGTWTLRITDAANGSTGTFKSWKLTAYGHRSTPAAPTIDSIAAGSESLTVAWTAPSNTGASDITAYDVRHIRSDAIDKSDGQWTVDDDAWTSTSSALEYTVSGLTADVQYDVQVRAENASGKGPWSPTVVGATAPANSEPTFGAETATRTLPENSGAGVNVVGGAITATDRNSGDTLTYSLASSGDHTSFEIDSSTGQLKTKTGVTHNFNFEAATNSYSVTVEVSDSKDADGVADTVVDDTIDVTINLTNVDEAGTVTLPATFTGGTAATASVSDPDGTVSGPSWRWARGNTATGSFSNISGATSAGYTPVAADVGKYLRATVTYTDPQGSGKTASGVSSSAVGASNAEPTFDDGAMATRTLPENSGAGVNVVGGVVAATDGDSDTLTYSLASSGDHASFEIDSSTGQLKTKAGVTHDFDFEASKNSYSVTVNVRDSKDSAGNADIVIDDTIAVTINLTNVNEAPVIANTVTTVDRSENTANVISVTASDVDASTTLSWSIESAGDGGKFETNVSTGAFTLLRFKNAPDFEMPTDVGDTAMNNTYVVTVKVTDNGSPAMSDTHTFTVTVTNVNEAPVFTSPPATADFAENGTGTVVDFDATDVDASTTLTFSMNSNISDSSKFDIDSTTGVLTFKNPPDFEMPTDAGDTAMNNTYVAGVYVRDNGSPRERTGHLLIVTVTDVNEAPVITSPPATKSVAENSTAVHTFAATDVDASDTQTWSVEPADDGGKFDINATTGALSFKDAPDFETPTDVGMDNSYVVTVKVTDDGSPAMSDTHTVTVTVTNVNEAPEITTTATTYTAFNVDENTATTDVIKTYEATDVDASTTLTWSLEGNDAGDFTITKNADGDGELKFRNAPNFEAPVDADTMNDYDIRVKVKDNGIPGNRGSSNQLDDTVSVSVDVLDINEVPVISGLSITSFAEIEYDATSPDLTVATYTYTDEDRNPADTITWGLNIIRDAAHFNISASGVLSFNMRPDFENPFGADNEYLIVVEADDGQGGVGSWAVIVNVTNVDETPEITTTASSHTAPSFVEIEYDATTADLVVADYDGRDEEGQTISWSRTGADAGDFSIDSMTGVLSFAQRPNFEMPADSGTDNVYNVTVRARDTASPANVRELAVVVTVTDVNERPDIDENFNAPQTYVEVEYDFTGTLPPVHTFTAEDYDVGDTIGWALAGTDAAYLEIDATTGVLTFTQDSGFGQGPLPNFEHPRDDNANGSNTYSIIVRAFDDATDKKTTDYAVVVTVTDVNEAPEFSGTPETAITLDEHDANDNYVVMDLADYDARDEEGGVSWSLTGTDRRDFAISADGVVTFAETPNYEAPEDSGGNNVYEFTVVATDEASGSSRRNVSTAVTVTVGDVEEDGTLAVDNLNPSAGQTVTFRLTDPDGSIDTTNMTWVIQSLATGGSWARVSGVLTPAATTFPWTVDEDETGKAIRAMVTYTDRRGSGKTALSQETAEVTADPIANAPPRFRGVSSWFVEEGPAGGAVGDPTTATDRDNDTLTYGIQSGQDSARFEIDPSSGQVRLAQALDFETTPGPLFFYLTLHDGKGVDSDNVEVADSSIDATRSADVHVVDVEEDGVVTLSDEEPGVATALTATLEDGDGGVSGPVWQWARSQNGRTGWTNISGATSSSYTTTQADPGFFLRATVTYTDRRGGGKSAEGITSQRVFGENQRPTFPPAEDGQRTIPENTPASANIGAPVAAVDPESGGLTYSLSGAEAAAFTIVETTGQIRVQDALDFETKSSYSLTVEVHDGLDELGNASMTVDDTQAVTITVENVEEPGAVTLSTASGTMQARVEVTAALSDEDGPTVVAWQWSRSPDGRTDWVNIAGATAATYTPTLEEDRGNYLRATASYSDDHGPNKTAEQVSARVGDPPPVNSPPVFPQAEDGQREVEENAADGTAIGAPVEATDLNAGNAAVNDPLAYSLSGTDAASFDIDSGSGQLRVAPGVELDYEGKRSYRVTVEVSDGRDQNGDDDLAAIDARQHVTITVTNVNEAPVVTGDGTASFEENSSSAVASYTAADPERDTLTWSVSGDDFWISDRGQLYFRTPPSFEGGTMSYTVTVTATDDDADGNLSGSLSVTVTVTDVEEEGTVTIEPLRGWDGTTFQAGLDDDDGGISGETWQWERSSNRSSWEAISGAASSTYTASSDDVDRYLRVTVTYEDTRGSGKEASAALTGRIEDSADRPLSNSAPVFTETASERSVGQGTAAGRNVGAPVRATDEDTGDVLTYSLDGTDAVLFDIDPTTGQLLTRAVLDYDPDGTNSYSVQVRVHDGYGADYQSTDVGVDATIEVTIAVTAAPATRGIVGGGGGGGGGGPSPSTLDFEWTVTHDIESLDPTHDSPTGAWSDGATLWVLENGDGADDAVYAYDLESGERVEEREFKLDERNRAPRGVWSDGETLWVSDSGQNKLFAYDLETGERLPERDIALAERNAGARGIWSDGERMYVLDSIFVYDLESGELLAECALDAANNDPRGIWSDGVTVWVSDHGAKRLFAYRLPVLSEEPDADGNGEDEGGKELERVRDEEFGQSRELTKASNNSPRGIWSDGDVMYVADASDGKVYSYNMPDAIDARLASLTLSDIAIGEFSSARPEYEGVVADGVTVTTVEATAAQSGAGVVIDPPDADGDDANGHQVGLAGVEEIAVTVTSADGSREKTYRVALADAEATPEAWSHCLRGDIAEGFSLVVFEGGSVGDLVACAESRGVTALYALHEGVYVSYILGAPEWVNAEFGELFGGGVPPVTPLTVKSNGPPSADPNAGDGALLPGAECLRGEIAVGFSLVVSEGGSVEDLVACAESRDVVTLYALHEGVYVSYIIGAPEWVNGSFRELFADGLPSITPLVVRSEGTPQAN